MIINILKPLNILLFLTLFYILVRYVFRIFIWGEGKRRLRLQTKLMIGIMPLSLIPSIGLFVLATGYLDEILLDLVIDPNRAQIIEHSDSLRKDYLDDLARLNLSHAPDLLPLCREGNRSRVIAYLDKYGLQGVSYYKEGLLVGRYLAKRFEPNQMEHIISSASARVEAEPLVMADGFLVARFLHEQGDESLQLIYTRGTPFTERFLFLRDSYIFLKHTERKTERVKDLNQGILLVATMCLFFIGLWTAQDFAKKFLKAFNELIRGAHQVAGGNLGTRLHIKSGDEIEDVVQAFNSMTETLEDNRMELESKARDLQNLNDELSSQIEYSNTLIHQIRNGLVSTDAAGGVLTFNQAACRILDLVEPELGRSLVSWLEESRHEPLLELWRGFIADRQMRFDQLELEGREAGHVRHLACYLVPLSKDDSPFGCLIILDDLTELLQAQKLAAWQEVARRIAHEIKNPLTPIQLSIQRIRRKANSGAGDLHAVIESAHETIMAETDLLKNLVNEFSTFAKMPVPVKSETDLADLVTNVVSSYQQVFPDVRVEAEVPPDGCLLDLDPNQIRQVLINLVQNAANACEGGGEIRILLDEEMEFCRLTVVDNGKGIPENERDKVFQPYYSKSPKGTGLGLAIVKRIIEDHGGSIQISGNRPRGTRFAISLPRVRTVV